MLSFYIIQHAYVNIPYTRSKMYVLKERWWCNKVWYIRYWIFSIVLLINCKEQNGRKIKNINLTKIMYNNIWDVFIVRNISAYLHNHVVFDICTSFYGYMLSLFSSPQVLTNWPRLYSCTLYSFRFECCE